MSRLARAAALAALLLAPLVHGAAAQEDAGGPPPKPIYLDIAPTGNEPGTVTMPGDTAVTVPGLAVRIEGLTARDLAGQPIRLTVTPPQEPEPYTPDLESACPRESGLDAPPEFTPLFRKEPPTELTAEIGTDGRFEAEFTPTVTGTHEVVAADAASLYRGESEFEVADLEMEESCEEMPQAAIEEATADLSTTVCEAMTAIEARLTELPPSPPKEELTRQVKELRARLDESLPCGTAPAWVNATHHIGKIRTLHPALVPPTNPPVRRMRDWIRTVETARAQAPKALAQITRGNLVCDQLDIIVNGLKFVDFYLGLIIEPAKFLGDWAKENVPTKLIGLIPTVAQTPALKDGVELSWKGILSYEPKLAGGAVKIGTKPGFDRLLAHQKMSHAVVGYAASRIFELLCQTFQGPVQGAMSAEFTTPDGDIWWRYTIEISGQLILRYPKDAKGSVIPLTGEFIGNASHIESWDNAVPVLYPELSMGTVFRTLRVEPIALDTIPLVYQKNLGASADPGVPDFNPIKSIIDQGGAITQFVMTPAFYRVPVRAELSEKTLRLELQPAAVDFDDLRVKVVHIILPVLSLWPDVIDYALPYKGAHFIMLRSMGEGPAEFTVETKGQTMKISRHFSNQRSNAEASGTYNLTVNACNPGC